jgi:hypothetical protein
VNGGCPYAPIFTIATREMNHAGNRHYHQIVLSRP